MKRNSRPFEDLDIIDNYLATAVASDPVVGKDFSRALVEGLLQIELKDNIHVNIERTLIGDTPKKRGIRMDIEVCEYDTDKFASVPLNVYDIEPNKRDDINIIKHNRFYQAKIDSRNLASGEKDFIKLPNLFVIMITNYDPFGYGYMLYTVRNRCEEVPKLEYEDGLQFLYFNTTGTRGGNEELKRFLTYIQDSKTLNVTDNATKRLHDMLVQVKESPEARDAYMMWEEMIFYERRDAKEEGREEENLRAIKRKMEKNKSKEQIADELELDIGDVEKYLDILKVTV